MKRVLIMPQFNEAHNILAVLEGAMAHVDHIVVVDDGSTDGSGALLRQWQSVHPHAFTLITLEQNRGMSGALLVGFSHVNRLLRLGLLRGEDVIVNIDADGQHRPEEIGSAVDLLVTGGYDVALGRRDLSGYPRLKQLGNRFLSWWASFLTGFAYHDVECGFRLMRARVVPQFLRYFSGRKYGCAQEIGVITALLRLSVSNDLPTKINYYRHGARITDGFVNMSMGALAWARVKLGMASDLEHLEQRVLTGARVLCAVGGELSAPSGTGTGH
ncbi:MAG: glycosyltransferase family 2 protein [bacterium]|nr:glycosyltransferase family 2 protein [bacterium]